MARDVKKGEAAKKRATRVRFKLRGTTERPRLSVFRSNKNIFAQIVDDSKGVTLTAASTLDKGFRTKQGDPFTKATARDVGKRIAERAQEMQIKKVVFDRGPYLFHGKVKALADGAREAGLDF